MCNIEHALTATFFSFIHEGCDDVYAQRFFINK